MIFIEMNKITYKKKLTDINFVKVFEVGTNFDIFLKFVHLLIRNVYNSCQVLYVQCKMRVLILGLVFRALLSQSIIVDSAGVTDRARGGIVAPTDFRGSSPCANFITANFITAIFKTITKIWLMRFYGLFILLLRT